MVYSQSSKPREYSYGSVSYDTIHRHSGKQAKANVAKSKDVQQGVETVNVPKAITRYFREQSVNLIVSCSRR